MNNLDQAVDAIRTKPSDVTRADAVAELQGIARDCEAAIRVWQSCLETFNAAENHWTVVSWLGAERVQQLHEINLSTRAHLQNLANLAGPLASSGFEDLIETAFRQPQPAQVGPDMARAAIARMSQRVAHVRALLDRFLTPTPVAKARPGKTAPKKAASRRRRRTRRASKHVKKTKKTRTAKNVRPRKSAKKKK